MIFGVESIFLPPSESRFLMSVDEDNMTKQPGVCPSFSFSNPFLLGRHTTHKVRACLVSIPGFADAAVQPARALCGV